MCGEKTGTSQVAFVAFVWGGGNCPILWEDNSSCCAGGVGKSLVGFRDGWGDIAEERSGRRSCCGSLTLVSFDDTCWHLNATAGTIGVANVEGTQD